MRALTRALKDSDAKVRYHAATALGAIGPGALVAVPSLIEAMAEPPGSGSSQLDTGRDPACAAARALGAVVKGPRPPKVAIRALTDTLRSEHLWRRGSAAEGLYTIGPGASQAVPSLVGALREQIATGQRLDRGSWIPMALGVLAPGSESPAPAVAALTDALDSTSPDMKREAARALGGFGPAAAAAVPRLSAAIDDPNRDVAQAARSSLAQIRDNVHPHIPRTLPD